MNRNDDGAHTQQGIEIKFSHVQLYVDHIGHVDEYKQLEAEINNKLSKKAVEDLRSLRRSLNEAETAFPSHGRDVVKVRAISFFQISTTVFSKLLDH